MEQRETGCVIVDSRNALLQSTQAEICETAWSARLQRSASEVSVESRHETSDHATIGGMALLYVEMAVQIAVDYVVFATTAHPRRFLHRFSRVSRVGLDRFDRNTRPTLQQMHFTKICATIADFYDEGVLKSPKQHEHCMVAGPT